MVHVERGGKVRTFHVKHATRESVRDVLVRNVSRETNLYTDESRLYTKTGKEYASHETVKHSAGEYARGKGSHQYHRKRVLRGKRLTYRRIGEV